MDWSSLIGPAVIAAIVSGVISVIATVVTTRASKQLHAEKLSFDREQSERKIGAESAAAERRFQIERAVAEREQRRERYWEIQDRLTALMEGRTNHGEIAEILREIRRLWVIAPPSVVLATNALVEDIAGQPKGALTSDEKLGAMVLAFREDLLHPDEKLFQKNQPFLTMKDFKVRAASLN